LIKFTDKLSKLAKFASFDNLQANRNRGTESRDRKISSIEIKYIIIKVTK